MIIKLKAGVRMQGVRPELSLGITIAAFAFFYATGGKAMIITSIMEGAHSVTSLHYAGQAFDVRTTRDAHLTFEQAEAATGAMKDALGSDFDVILEDNHIHVEYQPRRLA